jgi:tetratricopeptide (TPR) repeat protein
MDNSIQNHVIALNCQAMNSLENPKASAKLLQEAEALLLAENQDVKSLPNRLSLLAMTFNNLACHYKNLKQPNVALFYLNQALSLEIETFSDPGSIASTNLNLCAIYSQLGKHKKALKSAFCALKYLKGYENEGNLDENIINSIVVAYYNTGVEFEYINKYNKALEYYEKGYETGLEHFGSDHPMTSKLYACLKGCKDHYNTINSLVSTRKEMRNRGKFYSNSVSPSKVIAEPMFKVYKNKKIDLKLPVILNSHQSKLNKHRKSLEPMPFPSNPLHPELTPSPARDSLIQAGMSRTRKFSNAVERLKLLIN